MLIKELVTTSNYEKVWNCMYNDFFKGKNYTEEKIAYFKDAIKLAIEEMKNVDVEPQNDWLVVISESFDDITPSMNEKFMESNLYKVSEIKTLNNDEVVESGTIVSDWTEDALKKYFMTKPFIQSWGYEFSTWDDSLGMFIWDGSIEEYGKERCAGVVLFELTYCGFSQKQVEEKTNNIFNRSIEDTVSIEELADLEDDEDYDIEIDDLNIDDDLSESLKISYENWKVMYERLKKIRDEVTKEG